MFLQSLSEVFLQDNLFENNEAKDFGGITYIDNVVRFEFNNNICKKN